MMISQVFNKGNYNKWDEFVYETLPNINKLIRHEIIPQIDGVLISMLGDRSNIFKESINVTQNCDKKLSSISLDISYIIEDWKVFNAPATAIEADEKSLMDSLSNDRYQLQSLNIDTRTGELKIKYLISIEG